MTNTAIAIFAYRRPEHLRLVLNSLTTQSIGCEYPILLFIDGPRNDGESEVVMSCQEVAREMQNRLPITIIACKANRGLYMSLTEGVSSVLKDYEQTIVIEDDILVSPYFLEYMRDGLSCYSKDPSVASIHGYLPPISKPVPDTFFLRGADCWGWATWRNRWSLYRHDAQEMVKEIHRRGLARDFDMGGRVPNLRLLNDRAAGRSKSWAICWHASCFLEDCYTLHPGRSLVRNIGLDCSGEHCVPSPSLEAVLTNSCLPVHKQKVEEIPDIIATFAKQISPQPMPLRVFNKLKALITRRRSVDSYIAKNL